MVVSWCSIQITDVRRYCTLLKEEELEIYYCALWSISSFSGKNPVVHRCMGDTHMLSLLAVPVDLRQ